MIRAWRVLAFLATTALWAQPSLQTPASTRATGQSSAATQAGSAANSASQGSSPSQSNPASQTTAAPATADTSAQNAAPVPLRGPVQPIPFSHKQHAGTLQLPCEFCHAPSHSGETVAIPQAPLCMQCHQTMDTDNPGVQKLAAFAKSDSTIPWVRVYELPSFVTFSHKTHLQHGVTCLQCHGPVAERTQLYKETDISMAGCINCHRAKKASIDCDTCHLLDQ